MQGRAMSIPKINSMGTIFWQINANWQTASWATLDYSGNWKLSHSMIKQIFSPTHVTGYFDDAKTMRVYAISDSKTYDGAEMRVEGFNFDQTDAVPRIQLTYNINLKQTSSQLVDEIHKEKLFTSCAIENCFIRV